MVSEGGSFMGQVHKKLRGLNVEWAVLRPSWFMGECKQSLNIHNQC
jgi:1-deoxy-D-xylulose 5-phosphate reductoisomerase